MMVGDHFYVGLSARTNEEGIRQFGEILAKYGMTCSQVPLEEVLHLKTGVNYIENGIMLVSGEFIDKPDFAKYKNHHTGGRGVRGQLHLDERKSDST